MAPAPLEGLPSRSPSKSQHSSKLLVTQPPLLKVLGCLTNLVVLLANQWHPQSARSNHLQFQNLGLEKTGTRLPLPQYW